jgi:hypothetical protein
MQGRKGVGRFASAILGDGLLLETVADSVRTSVELNWNEFEDGRYLDQVKIPIIKSTVKSGSGTKLTITGGEDYLEQWSEKQLDHVIYELKKLVPPELENEIDRKKQRKRGFEIKVRISGFGDRDRNEVLKPFPLVELYDYRIAGVLHADGRGAFTYSCNCFKNHPGRRDALHHEVRRLAPRGEHLRREAAPQKILLHFFKFHGLCLSPGNILPQFHRLVSPYQETILPRKITSFPPLRQEEGFGKIYRVFRKGL